MNANFYRAFEERHRGPRTLIKGRLQVYLPFVETLRRLHGNLKILDLGCGRGEWLELLREHGIPAMGVDIDEQMLAACRERDLSVETADAITCLAEQSNESLDIVSAFHLVEHLPFDSLHQLVQNGLRALRPGGLLILETPNPENIFVGTNFFYLDPTHRRPLPPSLLAFLPEHHGFHRTKILRLNGKIEFAADRDIALLDVLGGASPDYAVIAQKQAGQEALGRFDDLFARHYGQDTDALAMRYEAQVQRNLGTAIDLARQGIQQNDAQQQQIHGIQEEVHQIRQQLEAIYTSRSWRVTAPLRDAGRFLRWVVQAGRAWLTFAPESRPHRVSRRLMMFLDGRPPTRSVVRFLLSPFPKIKTRFMAFITAPPASSLAERPDEAPIDLSPRQRRFYRMIRTVNSGKTPMEKP